MCPMCVIGSLDPSPSASLPVPEYSELVFMESVVEVTWCVAPLSRNHEASLKIVGEEIYAYD